MNRKSMFLSLSLITLAVLGFVVQPALCSPPQEAAPGKVVWAGVRSSQYGIKPFPSPEGWLKAMGR